MIDNKTSRLQLPLPNVENYLEDDVARLSDALTTLDGVVATLAEDGKLVQAQVPDYVARLDTEGKLPSDNLPVSAVQTNGEGKIPEAVIPEAIARDSEVLAKGANLSDLADRAAAWLNVRPVGSTPLAGDPVGDYDAATKRWVQNLLNTGSVGPTMNGVMNYGVGDFHLRDSRAYIQPYEVTSDGQLLNRADWPELWAYAQMLSPITDAAWLADPLQRSQYSTGNGSTTFRVPDRNGVQPGSLKGLFGHGSGDFTQKIHESAAPNITGTPEVTMLSGWSAGGSVRGRGAFAPQTTTVLPIGGAQTGSYVNIDFDASRSSPVYGRQNVSEIRPNSFVGVWVIRASGGFVAANTSWSVINGDAARPANNTAVSGGNIVSDYKVNGVSEGTANFRMAGTIGAKYNARISVYNKTKDAGANYDFSDDGVITSPRGTLLAAGDYGLGASSNIYPTAETCQFITDSVGASSWAPTNGGGMQTSYAVNRIVQLWISQVEGSLYTRFLTNSNPQTSKSSVAWSSFQKAGTSDINFKDVTGDLDLEKALANVNALEFKTFTYKDDESKTERRGIIAQQAETVDPEYVHSADVTGKMTLDSNPLLLDSMAAIKALLKRCETMQANIEALTNEIAELKGQAS